MVLSDQLLHVGMACISVRNDDVSFTRHIMMHQVLYIVQLPNEEGNMHII